MNIKKLELVRWWWKIIILTLTIVLVFASIFVFLADDIDNVVIARIIIPLTAIAFFLVTYYILTLRLKIDYEKKVIILYNYKRYKIRFSDFDYYDFKLEKTIDYNSFYKLILFLKNKKKIKISLSFWCISKKSYAIKTDEIHEKFKRIVRYNNGILNWYDNATN